MSTPKDYVIISSPGGSLPLLQQLHLQMEHFINAIQLSYEGTLLSHCFRYFHEEEIKQFKTFQTTTELGSLLNRILGTAQHLDLIRPTLLSLEKTFRQHLSEDALPHLCRSLIAYAHQYRAKNIEMPVKHQFLFLKTLEDKKLRDMIAENTEVLAALFSFIQCFWHSYDKTVQENPALPVYQSRQHPGIFTTPIQSIAKRISLLLNMLYREENPPPKLSALWQTRWALFLKTCLGQSRETPKISLTDLLNPTTRESLIQLQSFILINRTLFQHEGRQLVKMTELTDSANTSDCVRVLSFFHEQRYTATMKEISQRQENYWVLRENDDKSTDEANTQTIESPPGQRIIDLFFHLKNIISTLAKTNQWSHEQVTELFVLFASYVPNQFCAFHIVEHCRSHPAVRDASALLSAIPANSIEAMEYTNPYHILTPLEFALRSRHDDSNIMDLVLVTACKHSPTVRTITRVQEMPLAGKHRFSAPILTTFFTDELVLSLEILCQSERNSALLEVAIEENNLLLAYLLVYWGTPLRAVSFMQENRGLATAAEFDNFMHKIQHFKKNATALVFNQSLVLGHKQHDRLILFLVSYHFTDLSKPLGNNISQYLPTISTLHHHLQSTPELDTLYSKYCTLAIGNHDVESKISLVILMAVANTLNPESELVKTLLPAQHVEPSAKEEQNPQTSIRKNP